MLILSSNLHNISLDLMILLDNNVQSFLLLLKLTLEKSLTYLNIQYISANYVIYTV